MGIAEGRPPARHALRVPPSGDGRGDRLDELLQSPQAAFDAGLYQSDAVRAALVRRSAEASRMTDSVIGCGKQGQAHLSLKVNALIIERLSLQWTPQSRQ